MTAVAPLTRRPLSNVATGLTKLAKRQAQPMEDLCLIRETGSRRCREKDDKIWHWKSPWKVPECGAARKSGEGRVIYAGEEEGESPRVLSR